MPQNEGEIAPHHTTEGMVRVMQIVVGAVGGAVIAVAIWAIDDNPGRGAVNAEFCRALAREASGARRPRKNVRADAGAVPAGRGLKKISVAWG